MDDWVLWVIAAGVLAVGEMATLGFFLGPIAVGRAGRRRWWRWSAAGAALQLVVFTWWRRRRSLCCARSPAGTCTRRPGCAPAWPRWSGRAPW